MGKTFVVIILLIITFVDAVLVMISLLTNQSSDGVIMSHNDTTGFSKASKISKQVTESTLKKKPNVLFVLIDDLGTGDIPGYFDACKVKSMTNLEELLSKSAVFTDAHATPLCGASRYSFLSGNYVFRGEKKIGMQWNLGTHSQFKSGQKSIADMFSSAGYNTAMMGKWHVGGKVPPNSIKSKKGILTHPEHDWTMAFDGGPQDIGFRSSLITVAGIQSLPLLSLRMEF